MNRGLWIEAPMSEAQMHGLVTEAEIERAKGFGVNRRREYLAWRAIVRRELGSVDIDYNAVGAPVLVGSEAYISVSHGAGRIAVCISDTPCAVDVEGLGRNFERIASRYIHPDELLLSSAPHFAALVWCAKEVLYKLSGVQALDLVHDLRVDAVGDGWIDGYIKDREVIKLSVRLFDDAVVVWYS